MPPLVLARPRLMQWSGNNITDHNRSPLAWSTERIEQKQRMANGQMRKYWIADKRTFSCSWEMVPRDTARTVDGFWGGQAMYNFYGNVNGAFNLSIFNGDGTTGVYSVVFNEFSFDIVKRGSYDMWNVNVTMEQV